MDNDGVTLRTRESRPVRIAIAIAVLAAIFVVAPAAQGVVHGVTVTPGAILGAENPSNTETGDYTIVLTQIPSGEVVITVTPNSQVTVDNETLTFTTLNWNVAQTVVVTPVDDAVVEGSHTGIVTHSASGGGYLGVLIDDYAMTIADNDDAGVTVTESAGSTDVTEGTGNDTYSVVLDLEPSDDVTVTVSPDGQLDVDETTLTFTPGNWNSLQTVTVTAFNDNVVEGDHSGTITHSASGGGYGLVAINDVVASITDNDFSVAFDTASNSQLEGNAGSAPATVTVVLNTNGQPLIADATVDVVLTGGTATPGAGADFAFTSPTTVTFVTGQGDGATQDVVITVNGDLGNENDETVILGLANASPGGSIVAPVTHTLTIQNDDVEPGLSVLNAAPVTEGPAAELSFTVILSPASGQIVTVDYATANGTAETPSDYIADSDTLTFLPDETTKEVLVTVVQDGVDEISETLFLNLSAPLNTTLADPQGVGTILDIDNVAPLVGPLTTADAAGNPGFEFAPGQTVKLSGTFSDPGLSDTHTVIVDWGDGTTSSSIPITPVGSRSFEATHVYTEEGFYQIIVRADDADGGSSGERLAFVTVSGAAVGGGDDTVGLVDITRGVWRLYDGAGVVATEFVYGNPGDIPFMGDWDGDGIDTPGLYRQSDGFVYLRNSNTQGNADIRFFFGNPGDVPIAGDFNKDGKSTVSIYRPSNQTFYIINKLGANDGGLGPADFSYVFGNPGDRPYAGDFDGDGWDTVGLHRESTGLVYFLNLHQQGNAAQQFIFGDPGDQIIAGDWTGGGIDTPALYRSSDQTFYFRFTNTQGPASTSFFTGLTGWVPVSGNMGL